MLDTCLCFPREMEPGVLFIPAYIDHDYTVHCGILYLHQAESGQAEVANRTEFTIEK
jgi:hypothetical protein